MLYFSQTEYGPMTREFFKTVSRKNENREYLNFNNAKRVANISDSDIKEALLTQKTIFKERYNSLSKSDQNYDFDDILNAFSVWGPDGIYGKSLAEALESVMLDGEYRPKVGTSSNYLINGVRLSKPDDIFKSRLSAYNANNAILNCIDEYIESAIAVLVDRNQYLLAAAIVDSYKNGSGRNVNLNNIPPKARSKINGMAISKADKEKLYSRLPSTAETLGKLAKKMNALAEGNDHGKGFLNGSRGLLKSNGSGVDSFESFVRSIAACFNEFGGDFHEDTAAYALACANIEGLSFVKRSTKRVNKLSETNFDEALSGLEKIEGSNGKFQKNDLTLSWNKDGVEMLFGVNVKTRQGKEFRKYEGNSRFRAFGVDFGAALKKFSDYEKKMPTDIYKSAFDMYAAIGTGFDDYHSSWNKLKQYVGALTLVDALSGSGSTIGDFSTLIVVNDRVFSIADIINKIFNDGYKGVSYYQTRWLDVSANRLSETQKYDNTLKQAIERNREAYKTILNSKIQVTIKFGNIYGSSIFKK